MRSKTKNIIKCISVLIIFACTLTGCRGREISKDDITYTYHKEFESIEITNNYGKDVYADFDIALIGKKDNIIYKKSLEKELLVEGTQYYDIEEIMPEYIKYEKVGAMDVEIFHVYKVSPIKMILAASVTYFVVIFIFWMINKEKN